MFDHSVPPEPGQAADSGSKPPKPAAETGLSALHCPGCGKNFRMKSSAQGKKVRCPACQTVFQTPTDEKAGGSERQTATQAASKTQAPDSRGRSSGKRLVILASIVALLLTVSVSLIIFVLRGEPGPATQSKESAVQTTSSDRSSKAQPQLPEKLKPIGPTPVPNTKLQVPGKKEPDIKEPAKPEQSLRITLVPAVKLDAGKSLKIAVQVERQNCKGPIELRLEGLPAGVQASPGSIAADAETGQLELTANGEASAVEQKVLLLAVAGDIRTEQEIDVTIQRPLVKKPAILPKEFTNSIGMKLVLIPAGKFVMGSPPSERGNQIERPQHEVEIAKPFYLGVYEVTQEEYAKVMDEDPSEFAAAGKYKDKVKGLDTRRFPVESVSWYKAMLFCQRLSERAEEKQAGRVYRLPTEAEWEYACRAGTTTAFHFGKSMSSAQGNFDGDWDRGKSRYLRRPTTVGSYPPNAFGLYDMHGNVSEWCADWDDPNYYKTSPSKDPENTKKFGPYRIVRGGNWKYDAWHCRSAKRASVQHDQNWVGLGFRVAAVQADR